MTSWGLKRVYQLGCYFSCCKFMQRSWVVVMSYDSQHLNVSTTCLIQVPRFLTINSCHPPDNLGSGISSLLPVVQKRRNWGTNLGQGLQRVVQWTNMLVMQTTTRVQFLDPTGEGKWKLSYILFGLTVTCTHRHSHTHRHTHTCTNTHHKYFLRLNQDM